MSDFEEILSLLKSNQITENEADELLADVDYTQFRQYIDKESAIKETQLVDDAHQYLGDRYKTMRKAGLPASVAPYLDGMNDLPGSNGTVPTEFRWNTGNGTLRIATEYGPVNPMTGQKDVNPFLDPTDDSKALTLFEGTQEQAQKLGKLGRDAGGKKTGGPEKATEYVQRNIYRRSGQPIVMNNRGTVTATDMIIPREGQRPITVDGQATRPLNEWRPGMARGTYWRPGSQLYTRMNLPGGQRLKPVDRIKETERRFANLVDSNPDLSLTQLMDGAFDKGYISGYGYGNYPPIKGKVLDTSHQPKDKTFWTIYDNQFSNRNEDAFDTINKAPDGVMIESNAQSRKIVEGLRGQKLKDSVFFTPAQDSTLRMQVDHRVLPDTALARPEKVLEMNPAIKQFTNYEQDRSSLAIPSGQPTTKTFTKETPGVVADAMKRAKAVLKNPVVRGTGVALGAIPVLGDVADAATGTYDVVTGKTADQKKRGATDLLAGGTGLAALAAPAAAPVLAPISVGAGVGGLLADETKARRARDPKYTRNAPSVDKHIHSEANPVTIQAPIASPIVSETERRRAARRSTRGVNKTRPTTAKGWWGKAMDALGL